MKNFFSKLNRRPEDQLNEFLPGALEVAEEPPSPVGRLLGWSIVIFCSVVVAWSFWGQLDVVAMAQGKIIPSSRVKIIQPLQKGVVTGIYVHEGEQVKKGQLLIELDQSLTSADLNRLRSELGFAWLNLLRHQLIQNKISRRASSPISSQPEWLSLSQIINTEQWAEREWADYQAQVAILDKKLEIASSLCKMNEASVEKYETILPILTKRVQGLKDLSEKSYGSEHQYLELEQQRIEWQQELKLATEKRIQLKASLEEVEQQKKKLAAQFCHKNLAKLDAYKREVASLQQELDKAISLNKSQQLSAPVDGYVQQLVVHTIGGIVTDAQPLMQVVPKEDFLEVEVTLENKDIGFVREGQQASVKIDTFDFTQYGMIDAQVVDITADAIESEQQGLIYKMRLRLAESKLWGDDNWVDLIPGMTVMAEVKIRKRTIIDYFLSPIQGAADRSLKER